MERAFVTMLPWLGAGLAGSVLLLEAPAGRPLAVATVHLGAVVTLGLAAALVAVAVLVAGTVRAQPIEQLSPQS